MISPFKALTSERGECEVKVVKRERDEERQSRREAANGELQSLFAVKIHHCFLSSEPIQVPKD